MREKKRFFVGVNLRPLRQRWNFRGQIWVETMVYTLIAFALIGLVLAFVRPKIQAIQDKGVIEQSISVLNDMDSIISALGVSGNQRVLDVSINKGTLTLDGKNDKISISVPSDSQYSEPDTNVTNGNIIILTQHEGSSYNIILTRYYAGLYNLTFNNADSSKNLNQAPTPYKILIANNGEDPSGNTVVNMEVTS